MQTAVAACGFEDLRSDQEMVILLSKYGGAPPLYWHQGVPGPWRH